MILTNDRDAEINRRQESIRLSWLNFSGEVESILPKLVDEIKNEVSKAKDSRTLAKGRDEGQHSPLIDQIIYLALKYLVANPDTPDDYTVVAVMSCFADIGNLLGQEFYELPEYANVFKELQKVRELALELLNIKTIEFFRNPRVNELIQIPHVGDVKAQLAEYADGNPA